MLWTRSLVALLVCWSAASAGDWPQWLGPNRDGVSSAIVPPWKAAPRVVWRGPVGEGNSSPVVADGRVFLHAKVKDKVPFVFRPLRLRVFIVYCRSGLT